MVQLRDDTFETRYKRNAAFLCLRLLEQLDADAIQETNRQERDSVKHQEEDIAEITHRNARNNNKKQKGLPAEKDPAVWEQEFQDCLQRIPQNQNVWSQRKAFFNSKSLSGILKTLYGKKKTQSDSDRLTLAYIASICLSYYQNALKIDTDIDTTPEKNNMEMAILQAKSLFCVEVDYNLYGDLPSPSIWNPVFECFMQAHKGIAADTKLAAQHPSLVQEIQENVESGLKILRDAKATPDQMELRLINVWTLLGNTCQGLKSCRDTDSGSTKAAFFRPISKLFWQMLRDFMTYQETINIQNNSQWFYAIKDGLNSRSLDKLQQACSSVPRPTAAAQEAFGAKREREEQKQVKYWKDTCQANMEKCIGFLSLKQWMEKHISNPQTAQQIETQWTQVINQYLDSYSEWRILYRLILFHQVRSGSRGYAAFQNLLSMMFPLENLEAWELTDREIFENLVQVINNQGSSETTMSLRLQEWMQGKIGSRVKTELQSDLKAPEIFFDCFQSTLHSYPVKAAQSHHTLIALKICSALIPTILRVEETRMTLWTQRAPHMEEDLTTRTIDFWLGFVKKGVDAEACIENLFSFEPGTTDQFREIGFTLEICGRTVYIYNMIHKLKAHFDRHVNTTDIGIHFEQLKQVRRLFQYRNNAKDQALCSFVDFSGIQEDFNITNNRYAPEKTASVYLYYFSALRYYKYAAALEAHMLQIRKNLMVFYTPRTKAFYTDCFRIIADLQAQVVVTDQPEFTMKNEILNALKNNKDRAVTVLGSIHTFLTNPGASVRTTLIMQLKKACMYSVIPSIVLMQQAGNKIKWKTALNRTDPNTSKWSDEDVTNWESCTKILFESDPSSHQDQTTQMVYKVVQLLSAARIP